MEQMVLIFAGYFVIQAYGYCRFVRLYGMAKAKKLLAYLIVTAFLLAGVVAVALLKMPVILEILYLVISTPLGLWILWQSLYNMGLW